MQQDIDRFVIWCKKNKLTVNIAKTKYMTFGSKKCFKDSKLKIDGQDLMRVPTYKYLGVILDTKLT